MFAEGVSSRAWIWFEVRANEINPDRIKKRNLMMWLSVRYVDFAKAFHFKFCKQIQKPIWLWQKAIKGSKRLIVNKSLGETLLHRSARNNRLVSCVIVCLVCAWVSLTRLINHHWQDVVKHCLESGIYDVNARDNAGYTPLHECSSRCHLEVARLLLQYSADVNASATGGIRLVFFSSFSVCSTMKTCTCK